MRTHLHTTRIVVRISISESCAYKYAGMGGSTTNRTATFVAAGARSINHCVSEQSPKRFAAMFCSTPLNPCAELVNIDHI